MADAEWRSQMAQVRERGEFVDFTFVCEGLNIPVHKVVICSQSSVFRAACLGQFKEASSGSYDLSSHSVEMVQRMVDYLYTGQYHVDSPSLDEPQCLPSPLSTHAIMYALGDKYDIKGLMDFSAKQYSAKLDWALKFDDFLFSLPEVYNLTPESSRELRDVALNFARGRLNKSMAEAAIEDWFDELATSCPDFVKELLYDFLKHPSTGYCSCTSARVDVEILQCRCKRCNKGGASVRFRY